MAEDFSVKALFIGVSVAITMLVLSLIMTYFTTATKLADAANRRMDIPDTYDAIMKSKNLFEDKLTGTEVRSLIRKYANDKYVTVNIVSVNDDPEGEGVENAVNRTWYDSSVGIIKETKLCLINPSWLNKVEKFESGKYTTLKVYLNYRLDVL